MRFRCSKTLSYFSGFFSRLLYLTAICGEKLLGCTSFRSLNLGSAPTPNLTLGTGIFQALSLLHPSNFQCSLGLLFGLLSSSHLSSQPVWLLIPNLPFAVPCFASCNRHTPSTCSPAQFFQSSVWNPSPGQGPGLPPCLGKEFRLAVEAVQKSLTNEKLTTRSTALSPGGRTGRKPELSAQPILSWWLNPQNSWSRRWQQQGKWTLLGWQLMPKAIQNLIGEFKKEWPVAREENKGASCGKSTFLKASCINNPSNS